MQKTRSDPIVIALFVLALAPVRAQGDDGPAVFKRVCGNCHTPDRIVATRRSSDQWQEVIENMVSRGAKGSDEDLDTVLTYLLSHYGRVNVNHAAADDIVTVLGIDAAQAKAIVDYRAAHGPYADVDALAAVPGVDGAKLRGELDAISF